ncbi:MAG TPA: hypothetical protein VGI31_00335, partial [Streptosporangiaceae bacterium]
VRRADVLAYIGPVCAYPTGFLFSLTICPAPGGAGDAMIGFGAGGVQGRGPVIRVQVRFGGEVVDSAVRGTGRVVAGRSLLRDCGARSTGRVGHPHPRSESRWWVSPLPQAGPVEFAVFLPGEAEQSGAARMDASQVISAAGRSAVLWAEPG